MNDIRWLAFPMLLVLIAAQPCIGASGAETRLLRMIAGSKEPIRLQGIASLKSQPDLCIANLDRLIKIAKSEATNAAAKEAVRPSLAELLNLIGSTKQPAAEQALVELLDAPNGQIAMMAANALGQNQIVGAIDPLKKQVDRPEFQSSYGFRFNLVRSFALMKEPAAYDYLDSLQRKLDGQLRHEIEKLLEQVTADDFGGDLKRFNDWNLARKSKVVLAATDSDSQSRERMALAPSQYYGLDIHAKRLMFIIDHSGSMKEYESGATRLDRAKQELIRVIQQLPADHEFAIIFYESSVRKWRPELVEASSENKRDAISFVSRLGLGDRTNTHAALLEAFEFDDNLETVYLLTDGRPTTGKVVAPPAIITEVIQRNQFRNLQFNTIGIALEGPTEAFLKDLAELSGGEFRRVN